MKEESEKVECEHVEHKEQKLEVISIMPKSTKEGVYVDMSKYIDDTTGIPPDSDDSEDEYMKKGKVEELEEWKKREAERTNMWNQEFDSV